MSCSTRRTLTAMTLALLSVSALPALAEKTVRLGDENEDVKSLQTYLRTLSYKIDKLDGKFGAQTLTAVKSFQKDQNRKAPNSLKEDGVVGPTTWAKLKTAAPSTTGSEPTLRLTSPRTEGEAVRKVQQILKDKGYTVTLDGVYGTGTVTAIKLFQSRKNLPADGNVGEKTWSALKN